MLAKAHGVIGSGQVMSEARRVAARRTDGMRIIYLSISGLPSRAANSIHVMRMCEAFANNGHDVELLAPSTGAEGATTTDLYRYYGVAGNFRITRIYRPTFRGGNYLYGVAAGLVARKRRVDLAYARYLPAGFWAAKFSVPLVYEAHVPVRLDGRISTNMFNNIVTSSRFKHLVVISDALKTFYRGKHGIAEKMITVARDAAGIPGRKTGIRPVDGRLRVGYVGHLYEGRGIDRIVNLSRRLPSIEFHIVGGTEPDIARWRQHTAQLSNVNVHGYVEPNRTAGILATLDILLAPYQEHLSISGGGANTSKWMSPIKIFEYMAAGRPIVCSRLPVLQEVLVDGRNSLLCDPSNEDEWEAAILELAGNRELQATLARNAQAEVENHYTWDIRARKVLAGIMQNALAPGPA